MPCITISRQFGSGGSDVAKNLSKRIGWHLIDNDFIDRVSQEAGLSRDIVESREEKVSGLIERLASALALSSPEVLVGSTEALPEPITAGENITAVTERVIAEAVTEDNVILVGRGAQAYLASKEDVFHVFVVAPQEERVSRVAERLGLSSAEATKLMKETDEGRKKYVRTNYDRRWDDPNNYHLVVNTGFVSCDDAAGLIEQVVKLHNW